VTSEAHHGGADREGRVQGDELRVQCGLSCRERFWRHFCRRDRCIRRRFRRQPCLNNSDQSPPTHSSNAHSQPIASALPVNRPNRMSCAGITWIRPSSTSRSLPHPMAVVALAPWITPRSPWSTTAVLTVPWSPLLHALATRSKMLSWSVLNSPNPSPFWILSRSKSMQARASSSGSCPPSPRVWISR
jgi:hypothetical protein